MKPPMCKICDKEFATGGILIYFKENEEDIKYNKRFEEPGFVGHPSNAFWFCKEHLEEAIKYKNYTKDIALPKIKEYYK